MAGGCGAYAGIDADEYANEIGGERVGKMIGKMCIFRWWGVGRGRTLLSSRGRRLSRGRLGSFAFQGSCSR